MANIKWELHHYIQWLMEDAIKTYEKRFGKIKDDWIEALKIHKDWLYSRITTNETRKIVNNLLKSNDVRRHEAFTNSMVHVLKGEFLDTLRDVITPGCYKYNPLTMRTGAIRRYSIDLVRSLDIKRATTVEMEYADKLEEILVNLGGKDDPMHPSYKGVETV